MLKTLQTAAFQPIITQAGKSTRPGSPGHFGELTMDNTTKDTKPEWAAEVDWAFERREEARLDAMWDARFEKEED